jgi:hypothetical protein
MFSWTSSTMAAPNIWNEERRILEGPDIVLSLLAISQC